MFPAPAEDRVVLAWSGALALVAVVFSAWPGIDLWASGLFHRPGDGFVLAKWELADTLRRLLWSASILTVLVSVLALALSVATGGRTPWLPQRLWGFILALYLLGPGLLVNLVLKAHWGRARPDTVQAFGGAREFTAALTPASECARNCSFVSGEAAAAAALAIALAVVLAHLRPRISRALYVRGLWLAGAIMVVGGLLRLAAGRHFLSDVCFAILFVAGIAVMLDRLLLRPLPARTRLASIVLTTPATPPIRPATWAVRAADQGSNTDVVTIRADAPILWNSTASSLRGGRRRFLRLWTHRRYESGPPGGETG